MWGVLSLVRDGLQRRPRRQRAARVADESALGDGDVVVAPPREPGTAAPAGALFARAFLAMACGAAGLDGEGSGGGGGAEEEAWAASGWRPARAADEAGHLMVRDSMRFAIYA
ncbi:unnamed protein product [Urochloa humidicola]